MPVRLKLTLLCSCLWMTMSCAAENYEGNPAAVAVIDELVQEEGFDRAQLQRVFAAAERQQSSLEAIARPAEKTKPWYEYREIFLNEKREQQGREFIAEHRQTLLRAEQTYGVPIEIRSAVCPEKSIVTALSNRASYRANCCSVRAWCKKSLTTAILAPCSASQVAQRRSRTVVVG